MRKSILFHGYWWKLKFLLIVTIIYIYPKHLRLYNTKMMFVSNRIWLSDGFPLTYVHKRHTKRTRIIRSKVVYSFIRYHQCYGPRLILMGFGSDVWENSDTDPTRKIGSISYTLEKPDLDPSFQNGNRTRPMIKYKLFFCDLCLNIYKHISIVADPGGSFH